MTAPADITIRRAGPEDCAALRPLLEELGYTLSQDELQDRLAGVLAAPEHVVLLAMDPRDRLIGLLHAYARPSIEKPPEVTIQAMVVAEDARGQGIGRQLVEAVADWARARGFATLGLHTQTQRADAQGFYETLGFERVTEAFLYCRNLDG